MANQARNTTKENIANKRKVRNKKRRLRFFRLLFMGILFMLTVSAVLFVGVNLYRWAGNLYRDYQAMYQEYTERKESRQGAGATRFEGYTNILVLGVDDGADHTAYGGQNADTILLVSFENSTGRVRIITIPRDTWVQTPGGGSRLGNVYRDGGVSQTVKQVSSLLGISIHQYVIIDMQTFAELIDLLGGIDLYVEGDMNYEDPESGLAIHLEQGYQHLNGDAAQKYLRYRSSELGEVGRVQRQQKFTKALYETVLQLGTVPKLPAIAEVIQNRVKTSAEVFDSAHLASVLRNLSSETPVAMMLPGDYAAGDDNIWVPDRAEIEARIRELFPTTDIIEDTETK